MIELKVRFFFSSRRRHTRCYRDWSSDVCSSDLYVVEAELPGVKRDEVEIELLGNELAITGEIGQRERKGTLRRQARRTGRFEYRVTLPDQVDPDRIEANLAEGVLTIRVAKSERAQRRRIEVKS